MCIRESFNTPGWQTSWKTWIQKCSVTCSESTPTLRWVRVNKHSRSEARTTPPRRPGRRRKPRARETTSGLLWVWRRGDLLHGGAPGPSRPSQAPRHSRHRHANAITTEHIAVQAFHAGLGEHVEVEAVRRGNLSSISKLKDAISVFSVHVKEPRWGRTVMYRPSATGSNSDWYVKFKNYALSFKSSFLFRNVVANVFFSKRPHHKTMLQFFWGGFTTW